MHLYEHETLAPHVVRSPFTAEVPRSPLLIWAVLSVSSQQQLAPWASSSSCRSKQLLSRGREAKQQEGRPTQPLLQVPAMLLCFCNLCQVSFKKIKLADFKVFAPSPPFSPTSFPSAGSGCMQSRVLSWEIQFQTAAGHVLPHWPIAELKCHVPRAVETVTHGAWEVSKDLSSLSDATENMELWLLAGT